MDIQNQQVDLVQNSKSHLAHLTQNDLAHFREVLEKMAIAMRESMRSLTNQALHETPQDTGELNAVKTHPADQGSEMADQERALQVAEFETHQLQDVEDALRRLSDGSYGICVECGEAIPKARLEAAPYVRMDIRCQSEFEKQGRSLDEYRD